MKLFKDRVKRPSASNLSTRSSSPSISTVQLNRVASVKGVRKMGSKTALATLGNGKKDIGDDSIGRRHGARIPLLSFWRKRELKNEEEGEKEEKGDIEDGKDAEINEVDDLMNLIWRDSNRNVVKTVDSKATTPTKKAATPTKKAERQNLGTDLPASLANIQQHSEVLENDCFNTMTFPVDGIPGAQDPFFLPDPDPSTPKSTTSFHPPRSSSLHPPLYASSISAEPASPSDPIRRDFAAPCSDFVLEDPFDHHSLRIPRPVSNTGLDAAEEEKHDPSQSSISLPSPSTKESCSPSSSSPQDLNAPIELHMTMGEMRGLPSSDNFQVSELLGVRTPQTGGGGGGGGGGAADSLGDLSPGGSGSIIAGEVGRPCQEVGEFEGFLSKMDEDEIDIEFFDAASSLNNIHNQHNNNASLYLERIENTVSSVTNTLISIILLLITSLHTLLNTLTDTIPSLSTTFIKPASHPSSPSPPTSPSTPVPTVPRMEGTLDESSRTADNVALKMVRAAHGQMGSFWAVNPIPIRSITAIPSSALDHIGYTTGRSAAMFMRGFRRGYGAAA